MANQARKDLQSLLKIQDKLSESTPIQLIQEVEPRYGPTQPNSLLTLFLTIDTRSLVFDKPSWLKLQIPAVLHPVWSLTDSVDKVAGVKEDQRLSALETLGKWRLFWNTLSTNPFLLNVQNTIQLAFLYNQASGKRLGPVQVTPSVPIGLRIQTQSQQYIYLPQGASTQKPATAMDFGFPAFLSNAISNGPIGLRPPLAQHEEGNLWLFVEMPVEPHWLSPFDAFFAKCQKLLPNLRRAPNFDETFPGLARLGEHYRSLKLTDLDGILEEEGKRSKGELDVFGAKIPSELLTIVGLPALCVLLIQFLSITRYIRANTDTISVEAASKWSGVLS